jgi:hypothetical protein
MKRRVRSNSDTDWIIAKEYAELLTKNISKIDSFHPDKMIIKKKNQCMNIQASNI